MRIASDSIWTRFRRGDDGAIAVIFALLLVPLLAFATAAIEYGRMTMERTRIQVSADAVSLALAPRAFGKGEAEILAEANKMLNSLYPNDRFKAVKTPTDPVVSADGAEITLQVEGPFTPVFKFLHFPTAPLARTAKAVIDKTQHEIALVIDNSGSMSSSAGGDSKMRSAQRAAIKLIDAMMTSGLSASRTKFSVVPFTLGVKIGSQYRNESWMDRYGASPVHYEPNFETPPAGSGGRATRFDLLDAFGGGWAGCVETRPGAWATNDAAPTTGVPASLFVPMAAPDEPGDSGKSEDESRGWTYSNSYLDDNPSPQCNRDRTGSADFVRAQKKLCKYDTDRSLDTSEGRGPNYNCKGQALSRLTSNTTSLRNSINAMTADGNTNLLEGFTWGWRTLSPNLPFADGRAYDAKDNRKIIVLLTDGMNVWNAATNHNRSIYSPMGFYANARLGTPAPTNATEARAQMDAKTLEACNNAKASPNNVIIYTVGFSVSSDPIDSKGLALLKNCASAPEMAYVANDSEAIVNVFISISRSINGLRLAR